MENCKENWFGKTQVYNNIIQQDFANSFYTFTLKLLLQFSWANSFDLHGKFLMPADDGMFFHMPNLIEYHHGLERTGVQDFWIGYVHCGTPPSRVKASNTTFVMKCTRDQLP
jgi:beta-1,3-N-acetylglucosaminyltransferase 5